MYKEEFLDVYTECKSVPTFGCEKPGKQCIKILRKKIILVKMF